MKTFREVLETRDHQALLSMLADDVVFRSPAVYAPYEGRDQIAALLTVVGRVLEGWVCQRDLRSPDSKNQGLVFHARVGDREVEGCDFIHLDDDGLIDELYVMIRPLSGLVALAEGMSRELGLDRGEPAERTSA